MRYFVSFFVSFWIHIFLFFFISEDKKEEIKYQKLSLKMFEEKPKEIKEKPNITKPKEEIKEIVKEVKEIKEIKKEVKEIKEVKKELKETKEKPKNIIKETKKEIKDISEVREIKKPLPQPSSPPTKEIMPSLEEIGESIDMKKYKSIYGDEFQSFSLEQKEFIKNNLDDIGKITQSYLKYPQIAGKMGQSGDSSVEFFLHPNGDITELKLLNSSSFTILDKNSIHTIEIAYKDYPKPKVTTKVRIKVKYILN